MRHTWVFIIFAILFGTVATLPVVDKGVFVITGVKTCGGGGGYCILGADCTVDKEFVPDQENGHCDGLRKAFTPRAFFVCCMVSGNSSTMTVSTTTLASTTTLSGVGSVESESVESKSVETIEELSEESETTTNSNNNFRGDLTENLIEVQTEVGVVIDNNYSSCQNYNETRGVRLAATQSGGVGGICWTGAITRTSTGLSSYPDPGSFICTGALISSNLLLTTATCVSRLFGQHDLGQYKVALGSRHLLHPMNGPTADASYREIKELIIHEDYGVVQGSFVRVNDIALVRLSEGAFDGSYCTVCLPSETDENHYGEDCIVSGYSHPTNSNSLSNAGAAVIESDGILHEADQLIESELSCENTLLNYTSGSSGRHGDDIICASGKYAAEACFVSREVKFILDTTEMKKKQPKAILAELRQKCHDPKTSQVINYMTYSRSKEAPPCLSLGQLSAACNAHSEVPEDENKPYIIGTEIDFDEKKFRIMASTTRLLSFATKSKALHADATYKLVREGYPVIVVGTSDKNRTSNWHCSYSWINVYLSWGDHSYFRRPIQIK